MDTLPPLPTMQQQYENPTLSPLPTTMSPATTLPPTLPPLNNPLIGITTSAPVQLGSSQRVELSTVEKMVIGVATAITVVLIGIIISVSTRK